MLEFITGLYPTNHFQELPIIWLILLIVFSFVASLISSIYEKADLDYVKSLEACVNGDYSQYSGSSSYYVPVYTCQLTNNVACACIDNKSNCYSYVSLPSLQCSYIINKLPSQMNASYIIAVVATVLSGIYLVLCLCAYFYPSFLSMWLLWHYFQTNKQAEIERTNESSPDLDTNLGASNHRSNNNSNISSADISDEQTFPHIHTPSSPSHHRYKGDIDPNTGKKEGFGVFKYDNGDEYEGNFVDNKKVCSNKIK